MKTESTKAYVYQPMSPKEDGKFYGVGGLHYFGVDVDHHVKGITKADAQKIADFCNQNPENAVSFIEMVQTQIDNDWSPECGCKFESIFSNAVLLCAKCSELPHHNPVVTCFYPKCKNETFKVTVTESDSDLDE
jgi:hypothetical protein